MDDLLVQKQVMAGTRFSANAAYGMDLHSTPKLGEAMAV